MNQVARKNDIGVGTCRCHKSPISMTGVIVASTSHTFCDDLQVAVHGDIVIGNCGHTGVIIASSAVCEVEGRPVARVGDSFVGCFTGVIVSGSPITDSD